MYKIFNTILIILFIAANIFSQDISEKQFITIIPGEQYKAGWFHDFWFGKHWRDLWTTPITVPILDLSTFAGGLTPIKVGGGLQTKSLRFQGKDGNVWKFRSMSKDPTKVLDADLQE